MTLGISDLFGKNTTSIGNSIGVSQSGKSINIGTLSPYKSWEDYYDRGIIPNLWKGFTGQTSADRNTDKAIASSDSQAANELALQEKMFNTQLDESKRQFDSEQAFQGDMFGKELDFANRNLEENIRQANLNYGLQREAYEYQKQLNSTQMEREDSAIQRQMKDLQAAGFSPLAAIGGNGASTSALSAGQAAQYDMSGINQNLGIYADFARQYASLHQKASENYMSVRNNAYDSYASNHASIAKAHNSEVLGARMALSQMKSDLHYKGQNMAMQYFNSAVNYRNQRLQNDYLQEQTNYLKDKHSWESQHGFRGETLANIIASTVNDLKNSEVIKSIANDLGISSKYFKELAEKFHDNHSKSLGQSLIDSNDLSFNEKTLLNDAAKKTYNKDITELDTFEMLNIAEACTRKEDKLGYKIIKFFKGIFGL